MIFKNAKNEDSKYIIRYEPSEEWFKYSKDFQDYSGKITFYTIAGEKHSSFQMANGDILLNTSYDNTKGSCDMLYDGSVTLCMPVWEVDKGWVDVCETTYYYTMECSGGGGDYNNDNNNDGDGVAPGEFPDTGGGFTPPTIPEPEPENPCEQMGNLEEDSGFKERMEDLAQKTDLDYEIGFLLTIEGDQYNYKEINGQSGEASIDLPNNIGTINGYMHTHYTGLYSTFSGSDIRAIYQLYRNNNISNLESFTASVVTNHSTTYSLKIASELDFLNFASVNLRDQSDFEAFEIDYNDAFDLYSTWYGEKDAREMALLKIIEGSGLVLFKGNNTFDDWQSIKLDSSSMNVVNDECN